jgi:hypothetical protein
VRKKTDFEVLIELDYKGGREELRSVEVELDDKNKFKTNNEALNKAFTTSDIRFFHNPDEVLKDINWVVDYWTSKTATDSFVVKDIVSPEAEKYLVDSLSGVRQNVEVAQLICYFDYLKGSEAPLEKTLGEYLYKQLKKIIKLSLSDGELAYISRKNLEPVIRQNGQEITLDKLSSGNLYLIQCMVSLLGKMYSVHLLKNTPVEEICHTQGLLLIDEAENHLHPKWQKTFIKSVQEIFPNLQIILTTHSPFIVSSVENARIYACESQGDHCIVKDETAEYSNKPIEEILLSPLFGGTYPFNDTISELLRKRKQAIQEGNKQEEQRIENQLKTINPDYFAYLDIDNLLGELSKATK